MEGNADANKDRNITNGELLAYMDENVSQKASELEGNKIHLLLEIQIKYYLNINEQLISVLFLFGIGSSLISTQAQIHFQNLFVLEISKLYTLV